MRIGQTTIIHFVSKFIGSILGFIATIYFARELGETVIGRYSLVLSLVALLGIFNTIGISGAMVKRISEDEEPAAYFSAGSFIIAGLTAISIIVVVLFRNQIHSYVGINAAKFVIVVLLAHSIWILCASLLKGSHLVHVFSVLSSGGTGTESAIQISLVIIGFGLAGMVYGYAGGLIAASAIGFLYSKPQFQIPRRRHFKRLFDYAKFSWLGSLQAKTYAWVDIVILGLFVQSGLIGAYTVAWSLVQFLNVFGSSVSASMFPKLSKESFQDQTKYVSHLVEESLAYAGLFIIPGMVGGTLLGDRILLLYGSGFVAGTQVLLILFLGMLTYSYMKQLQNALNAIDRPDLAFRANAAFILSNAVLNLLLIYLIGWVGAAIATALSSSVGLGIAYFYTRVELNFEVPTGLISRQLIAAIAMGGIVFAGRLFGVKYGIVSHNVLFITILVSLGAASYFAVLYVISIQFRTTVQNNLSTDFWFFST